MIEEKLQRLIRLEWEEFQNVHNKGSRAPCQDDRKTFWIMRSSLFAPWSEEMIDSWYDDLLTARAEGHELVAEKYAWMMERTAPEEFQQIKHLLKVPSGESLALIAEIISLEMRGMDEYRKTYPILQHRTGISAPKRIRRIPSPLKHICGESCTRTLSGHLGSILIWRKDFRAEIAVWRCP